MSNVSLFYADFILKDHLSRKLNKMQHIYRYRIIFVAIVNFEKIVHLLL